MKTFALMKALLKEQCTISEKGNVTYATLGERSISWVDQEGKAMALLGWIGDQDVTHQISTIKNAISFLKR